MRRRWRELRRIRESTRCWSSRARRPDAGACSRLPGTAGLLLGEEGWDEINYSLALYDTLAGYVFR